ncbi:MAG: FeoB-associated Cys-rich membrane protein [Alistipes sp.]|nr:FeoB-associated Cys-rich membrane protein [Alistipes sp.]
MEWQDWIVGGIGLAVAAVLFRRIRAWVRDGRRGDCASCANGECPSRRKKNT